MEETLDLLEDVEYEPTENPDWGFARNVRSTLLTPSAEWVQSVASFTFDVNGKIFIAPNRDYPYEGLVAYQGGENWKFIDCIALSLRQQNGDHLPLIASGVKINPWRVQYQYRGLRSSAIVDEEGGIPIVVSYYLHSQNIPELITGSIEVHFPEGLPSDKGQIIPLIQPFIDIRHMYGGSALHDYRITSEFENKRRIQISNGNRTLTFFVPNGDLSVFREAEIVNWRYKLGTGSRTENQNETVFIGEEKNVTAFFSLQVTNFSEHKSLKLHFSTRLSSSQTNFFLPDIQKNFAESKRKDHGDFQNIIETFPLSEEISFREAIWARIIGLTKFKTYIYFAEAQKYIRVPHAGAWWFKTAWFRDVFEALLNSFETLIKIPQERADIREIILSALSFQDKRYGLILNKIPEFTTLRAGHNSCDATLLCFMVANAYIARMKDIDLALEVLACAGTAISCFKANRQVPVTGHKINGPPEVDETNGLLLCAPHHSWIDTRTRRLQSDGCAMEHLPNRLSLKFLNDLYRHTTNNEDVVAIASSPCFFLPEINAQWITMLAGTIQTIDLVNQDRQSDSFKDLRAEAESLLTNAKKHFKPIFWNNNNGYLFNTVFEDGVLKDDIECEAGVTAAAILGETVFNRDELKSTWECAGQKLLASRRLIKYGDEVLPFGIITKNEDQRIFYDDDQYHSDMIWPRSTPYLIKLLRLLNEDKAVRDILINNLDHQMTECAIFYNQELFSRAFGNNAHPASATSQNPVPVKNPIQLWSQWCDAYLEVFGGKE